MRIIRVLFVLTMCVLAKNAEATEIYVRADSLLSAGDTLFVSLPGQEDLDFIAMETRCAMPSAVTSDVIVMCVVEHAVG